MLLGAYFRELSECSSLEKKLVNSPPQGGDLSDPTTESGVDVPGDSGARSLVGFPVAEDGDCGPFHGTCGGITLPGMSNSTTVAPTHRASVCGDGNGSGSGNTLERADSDGIEELRLGTVGLGLFSNTWLRFSPSRLYRELSISVRGKVNGKDGQMRAVRGGLGLQNLPTPRESSGSRSVIFSSMLMPSA